MDKPNDQDHAQPVNPGVTPTPAAPALDSAPEAAPPTALTPRQWLAQNGLPLLIILAIGVWLYRTWGFDGIVRAAYVVVGLGFVVFIHELGHFLAAKWCDVHVTAFSLGFGPALPGCQWVYGETTYKVAMFPLGGYVAMVGEGTEADEDEDYPRSFKNKTVPQRMLIISAGVIMNVLFGLVCLTAVYRYQGLDQMKAGVWYTDPGSPAWNKGVKAGWEVAEIDGKKAQYFEDLKLAVAFSWANTPITFGFDTPGGMKYVSLEPVRDANNTMPAIGVAPGVRLALMPARLRKLGGPVVQQNTAAARARVLELGPEDVVTACTDKDGKVTDLPKGEKAWAELARRMMSSTETMQLRVKRRGTGEEETLEVPAKGFDFGDEVVGMTAVGPEGASKLPTSPFDVTALKGVPGRPATREYRRRLVALRGKPAVFRVSRPVDEKDEDGERTEALVFVPPAYHRDFGLVMKMGKVAAIRDGSAAAGSGLAEGDVISEAGLLYGDQKEVKKEDWIKDFDPVRLPDELFDRVHKGASREPGKYKVVLKVTGSVKGEGEHDKRKVRTLEPIPWDDNWLPGDERPHLPSSPMSIPQLGIAYWVDSTVASVKKGSPADKKGMKDGDQIVQWRYRIEGNQPGEVAWSKWAKMASQRDNAEVYDQWAFLAERLQTINHRGVELKVERPGSKEQETFELEWTEDETWPRAQRGLRLIPDIEKQQASSLIEAAGMGVGRTLSSIKQIYLVLRSMIVGRLSTSNLGGPIEIAKQAFTFAGLDWLDFVLFLAMISIQLAVLNFLPIPILDGGHMVFLIYEGVSRQRPSETVQTVATIVGLVLILSLMAFVFYLDIYRTWVS